MGKRVFMFHGQGSQYIGMGKEFYDTMPNAKAVIDLASEQTGLDIPALCFEENDKLNITEYTQICMLAVEAAFGLFHRHLLGVADGDFLEVFVADLRLLLGHGGLRHLHISH